MHVSTIKRVSRWLEGACSRSCVFYMCRKGACSRSFVFYEVWEGVGRTRAAVPTRTRDLASTRHSTSGRPVWPCHVQEALASGAALRRLSCRAACNVSRRSHVRSWHRRRLAVAERNPQAASSHVTHDYAAAPNVRASLQELSY